MACFSNGPEAPRWKGMMRLGGLAYIRKTYGVPASRGADVRFRGRAGVIVGSRGPYLLVRLDSEKHPRVCHPTWEMAYLDDNRPDGAKEK